LWAPLLDHVEIEWIGKCRHMLEKSTDGCHTGIFPDARPGDLYYFHPGNGEGPIPDPAARAQPEGVFGPSQLVEEDYAWTDAGWRGVPFSEWVIYEVHTGTFSARHDFRGIIDDLPRLRDLGVTVLELMPVSTFSGARGWGYDGVLPFAPLQAYGGP